MRMGSLAKLRSRLVALFVATMATMPLATFGQERISSDESGDSPGSQGPRQALYMAPDDSATAAPPSRYVDANGNQMIVPAGYCEHCSDCNGGDGGCGAGGESDYSAAVPTGRGRTPPPA